MTTRLEQLHEFLNDDPNDPFNIYALALEYQKSDVQRSKAFFDQLLNEHPEYVPTYYHAANLYLGMGLPLEAVAILEKGIDVARRKNESKAVRELQGVLDEV